MAKGKSSPGGGNKEPKQGTAYTPDQAAAAGAMAAAMERMARVSPILEASFKMQAESLAKMAESMKALASSDFMTSISKMAENIENISKSINAIDSSKISDLGTRAIESDKKVNDLSGSVRKSADTVKKAKKEYEGLGDYLKKNFPVAAGAAAGAINGLKQGFTNFMAIGKSIFGFLSSIVGAVFKVGKAILSIPFKIFGKLIDMADNGGGQVSELAEAINGMRKEFGSLSGPTNKAIMSTASSMNNLKLQGTSVVQVFGNKAERLKQMTELYAQAGPALRGMAADIAKNNGAALAYQKGLGLTNEQMETMASVAKSTGRPIEKVLNNITKQADGMAKAFNLDAKVISREMAKAAQDFKNFGNVSEKQLGVAVTYAAKLGLNLDKITGTMDAFGTFDDAADNVSKLNEAFGTNINAMEILQAQTPEEKMEILRKEMRKAGVEGEKLNAAQRKLIAGAAGMDDQTAIAAFSTKNYGVSLSKIKAEGEKNEKKTLTQAEAMNKLADAMERILKAGPTGLTGGKGLLGAFMNGINAGIQSTPEFITMMRTLKQTIVTVWTKGRELGQMFVAEFPGVKEIFKDITALFNPKAVGDLLTKVNGEFKAFFMDLKKGEASFPKLMENIKTHFFSFFDKKSPQGQSLIQNFQKFWTAVGEVFAQAGVWLVQKLAGLVDKITEWIKNPKIPQIDPKSGMPLLSPFQRIFEAAGETLWPAIKTLGSTIFEKIKESLMQPENKAFLMKALAVVAAIIIGPAIIGALAGALAGGLLKGAGGLIVGGISKAAEGASNAMKGAKALKAGTDATAAAMPDKKTTDQLSEGAAAGSKIDMKSVGAMLVGLAGMMTIGLVAFKAALSIVRGVDMKEIALAGLVLLAVGNAMSAAAKGAADLVSGSRTYGREKTNVMQGLLAVAGIMTIGLVGFIAALKVVKALNVELADIGIVTALFIAMGIVMAGAIVLANGALALGKVVSKAWKDMVAGLLSMAAILTIGVVPFLLVLEKVKGMPVEMLPAVESLFMTMLAVLAVAGLLAVEAGLLGALILNVPGGAIFIIAGLVAMAAVMMTGLIPFFAALVLIKALGVSPQEVEMVSTMFNALTPFMAVAGAVAMAAIPVGAVLIGAAPVVIAGLVAIAGVMIGGILVFLAAVDRVREAKITTGDIMMVATIMRVMEEMFKDAVIFIAAAIVAGIAIIAGQAPAIAGAIALTAVMFATIEMGRKLIEKSADLDKQSVINLYIIMQVMADLFKESMVFIAAAALIGAYIVSSMGVGGVAILAGLATLKKVTDGSVDTIIGLMNSLSQVKENPATLLMKTQAFTALMDSVSKFTNSIGVIFKTMDFGFFESGASINERLRMATDFVKTMIEGSEGNGKGGIIGVVNAIMAGLKELDVSKIMAAEAFGKVLSAVAELIGAIAAPMAEMQKNTKTSWFTTAVEDNMEVQAGIGQLQSVIMSIMGSVKDLITSIITAIARIDVKNPDALKAMGEMLSGTLGAAGQMIGAMAPAFGSLKKVKPDGSTEVDHEAINKVSGAMMTVISSLTGPQGMTKMVENMVAMVERVDPTKLSKERLEAAGKIVSIMASAAGAVSGIMGSFKPAMTKTESTYDKKLEEGTINDTITETRKTAATITAAGPSFAEVMEEMSTSLPGIIGKIMDAVKGLPDSLADATFTTKMDNVVKMFSIVKSISEFFTTFVEKNSGAKPPPDKSKTEAAIKPFEGWSGAIDAFSAALTSLAEKGAIATLSTAVDKVGTFMMAIDQKKLTTIQETMQKLGTIFGDFSKIDLKADKDTQALANQWWYAFVSIGNALSGLFRTDGNWLPEGWKSGALPGTLYEVEQMQGKLKESLIGDIKKIKSNIESIASLGAVGAGSLLALSDAARQNPNGLADVWWYAIMAIGNALWGLTRTDGNWKPKGWGQGVLPGTIVELDALKPLIAKINPQELATIQSTLENLTGMATTLGKLESNVDAVKLNAAIASIGIAMDAIVGEEGKENLFDKIIKAAGILTTDKADQIVTEANKMEKAISKSILPALKAVQEMARAAAKLEEALQRGSKIDIAATMKTFTSSLGTNLAASGVYTVKTNDVVVKVNLRVAMDASELSNIMMQNKESVIRQRLNLLLDAVQEGTTSEGPKKDAAGAKFTGDAAPSQLTKYAG